MSDSAWDQKMKAFLKKTGDDFKRFGREVKDEAQKLMHEVKDPEKQAKLREGLKDVGHWARKAAEDVATVMETGVKKAEDAFRSASGKVEDFVTKPADGGAPGAASQKAPEPAPTPPSPPPDMDGPPKAAAPKKAAKTVGPRKKKPAPKKGPASKKTIGKKAAEAPEE